MNKAKNDGATPLFIAAQKGHGKVVEALLQHADTEPNKAINDGATPLFMAAQKGHDKIVEILLSHGTIDVNKAEDDGATPLYIASQEGHMEVVKVLLKHDGLQVNKAMNDGFTPLYRAAAKGHGNVVALLKKRIKKVPNDNPTCIVCMDRKPEVALVPCGHQNLCGVCAYQCKEQQDKCPTDRIRIVEISPLEKEHNGEDKENQPPPQ